MKLNKTFNPNKLSVTGEHLICTYRENPELPEYTKEQIETLVIEHTNYSRLELIQVHYQDGERWYALEDQEKMDEIMKQNFHDNNNTKKS